MARLEGVQFGNYEMLELIGSGGMAEVYRAHQGNAFGREVAVKVIKRAAAEQPLFYERFLREAQTTARLSHPHILPLIEFGAVGRKRKHFFLVMPYVPEGTLRDLLKRNGGPLPLEVITPIFLQLCEAVQYAHDQGLVHRDIKPSNILLQRAQHVWLADFGIALDIEDMRLTSTGLGLGTPEYTSPEQAQGMVDKRNDLYSLGVVLFELLTGQVPFSGRTPYEVFYKQTSTPTPTLHSARPDLPASYARFDPLIQQALAKEPAQRFQSARAMGDAFQAALAETASAPATLVTDEENKEPALAGRPTPVLAGRANQGMVTRADDDPLGERPTRQASVPIRANAYAARLAQAAPPAQRRSKVPLVAFALVALVLVGGAALALSALLLNPGSHSLNAPHIIPTATTSTQQTPTAQPTKTPRAQPTQTPTPTPTPSPTPSPTPTPEPSPTPTPTPLPLPTVGP
jgi:serine/threonine protein kinase